MADFSNDLNLALRIRALVEGQDAVVDLGNSFIDLNQRIENLIRGLTAISGSTEGAQREFEYLADVAQKYGLKILDLSDNYVKLIASSKGTALEGEAVKKVFESVSGAMSVLGGDTITTHRAFTALAQMMSKGQIYSEELKGQLAEAIPGALGIMSRALDISTKDLLALMEAGALGSEVLLPFADQLATEFGNIAATGRTFTQAVNDLKNTWTLLMKRFEDGSGAFSAISASIEYLSKSSGILAGAVGVGLAVAFGKLTASIAQSVVAAKSHVALLGVQANATQLAAKANLEAAVATNATAAANAAAARQSVISLSVQRSGTLSAAERIRVEAALRVALANRTIAEKQAAAAALQLAAAEKAIIGSTTGFSRVLNFLAGPGGLILTAIAAFGTMAFAFREQDEATKSLTKSTDDYAESLKKMGAAATVESIGLLENQRKEREKLVASLKDEFVARDQVASSMRNGAVDANFLADAEFNVSRSAIDLEKAQADLAETEAKLAEGRSALIDKTADIIEINERNRLSSEALNAAIAKQREEIAKLEAQKEEGLAVDLKIDASYKNLARLRKEAATANANLTESQRQYNAAVSDYADRQKQLALDAEGTTGTLEEQGLTTEQLSAKFKLLTQAQLAATNRLNQLKNAVVELTARQENLGTAMRAEIDLQERLAAATGNSEKQRAASIAKAQIEQEISIQGVAIAETSLRALEEEIVQKKILLETNPKLEKQTAEQIAKLEAQVIAQKAQVAQRIANAKAAVAEAEAAKVAGEILSNSLERQRIAANQSQIELAKLRQQYIDMAAAGEGMNELLRVLEAIRLKEKEIADQSNNTEIAVNAAFRSLGLNAEEVLTGMDFETRKAIDALKTLGVQGKLTGDDLRKAMDKAIDLADTETEIESLKSALYDLAKSGKTSTEEYKQSIVALNVKLAEMRAELDPTQRALDALGLGVPERMNAISKSMKANSEIVRDGTKSLALGQDAFLKYAEAEIEAARAGDRAVDAQVKAKAEAIGLSNAYAELNRNLARANPEFDAIAANMDRITEISEKRRESITGEIEADIAHIETIERKNMILGEGVEMARTLIEQSDRSIALAKEQAESDRESALSLEKKIAALELELKTRGKLSPIQERELEMLRLELPLKRQSAAISSERARQIEQEAFSQAKVVEQINRVVEASIIEESAASAVLRSRLETIESEIDLAKAKGDTSKAMDLQAEKSRVEKDILDLGIQAREDATVAARAYADALVTLAEQDGTITEIERQGIETARQKIEILEQEEIAYRENAEAIKAKSQAEIESVEAANKARESAERTRAAGQIVTDTLNGWIDKLKALSPAAVEAFEKMRGFTDSAVATETSSDGAKRSIDELGAAMVSLGGTGFVRFMNEAAVQALTVEAAFYAQAQSADSLAQSLNEMADSGTGNMEAMIRSAESARATMDLLDKTRLDALQSAIDRARGAMDSLRESSEAALEAAQRALAQQQGDQRALIELDRKQKIAELDRQIAAAEAANDLESLANLQKALDLEERTYNLKLKSIEAEREKDRGTAGDAPSGGAPASRPSGGTTTINNTFLIDPTKLANEEWVKRNVMPTIEKVGRLRA